jgi:hypothetical protein
MGQAASGGPHPVFFIFFVLFVVRLNSSARQRCWMSSPPGAPLVAFVCRVCRALAVAHNKDCLPCVSEESAQQRDFIVQKSDVRLDKKRAAKPLRCAF